MCCYLYIENLNIADTSIYNLLSRKEYEVKDIMDFKIKYCWPHYLIKWKGWPDKFNEWINEWSLGNVWELLKHIRRHRRIKNYKISYWIIKKLQKPQCSCLLCLHQVFILLILLLIFLHYNGWQAVLYSINSILHWSRNPNISDIEEHLKCPQQLKQGERIQL